MAKRIVPKVPTTLGQYLHSHYNSRIYYKLSYETTRNPFDLSFMHHRDIISHSANLNKFGRACTLHIAHIETLTNVTLDGIPTKTLRIVLT